jgi:hypothetical protein
VALTATNTASGVQKTQYRKQGATFWTDLVGDQVTLTTADDAGIFTYDYQAVEWAGNPSSAASIVVRGVPLGQQWFEGRRQRQVEDDGLAHRHECA